jgi:thiamine biosynthesis protein ThiI
MKSVIVHYQEIALKGKNRPWFINRLVRQLRAATADLDVVAVRSLMGRIELVLGPSAAWPTVRERLERVFGIANFSRAGRTRPDLDELGAAILADLAGTEARSFRITARRADKRFPVPSPDIERLLGARVQEALGWRVQLDGPDLTIHVEVLHDEAFYFFGKHRGAGGLPTGASGRVLCLTSGGIDSPVAAWRIMRRGCNVHLVHFHGQPYLPATSQQKVREIAALLARYQLRVRLYSVAFGDLQRQVVLAVPAALRVVVYRRFMLRIAEVLARTSGARAIATGEVIGQVASQTLENLAVIDAVAGMPVLRPLIGTDKEEITLEAERIGTFPISIVPDEDCCTLFTPRHPVTRARLGEIETIESKIPVADMVRAAVAAVELEDFSWPPVAAPPLTVPVLREPQ